MWRGCIKRMKKRFLGWESAMPRGFASGSRGIKSQWASGHVLRWFPGCPLAWSCAWGRSCLHLFLCADFQHGLRGSFRVAFPSDGLSTPRGLLWLRSGHCCLCLGPLHLGPSGLFRDGSAVSTSLIVSEFRHKALQSLNENLIRTVSMFVMLNGKGVLK